MRFSTVFTFFLVSLSKLVYSSPILASREEEIVWSPTITYPLGDDTVWQSGNTVYNMTWETDNIPENARNNTGIIMLGYLDDNDTSSDEHLDWRKPLASGFPLTDGIAYFTLDPSRNLTTRDSYILCLLGDSGNISNRLTIQAAQA
ncbi:hypothetical protein EV368DRAFT_84767 [Lentinula lateritia]|uniref:Uncharacterized protein n=1 Tax=Lentinula aff. lateritia TaxID=2804960 RepID=A0ACC1TWN4_9AGAR|nr:hypothetical protein F5876DRAFT_66721 [Lentinula aff. lateritia]KAJ3850219.1 hypothetical protein EV368DRAFT_84767 [Lentinula lateritia]